MVVVLDALKPKVKDCLVRRSKIASSVSSLRMMLPTLLTVLPFTAHLLSCSCLYWEPVAGFAPAKFLRPGVDTYFDFSRHLNTVQEGLSASLSVFYA